MEREFIKYCLIGNYGIGIYYDADKKLYVVEDGLEIEDEENLGAYLNIYGSCLNDDAEFDKYNEALEETQIRLCQALNVYFDDTNKNQNQLLN